MYGVTLAAWPGYWAWGDDLRSRHDLADPGPALANQGPSAFQTSTDTALTVSMPYCSDAFSFVSTAIR